jgi:hypothetical protein
MVIAVCTRGVHALLLEQVLQRQAVHDRAEHAHVVGAGAVHAALGDLRAAEEVAAADDDRDLHAAADDVAHLPGDVGHHVEVEPDRAAAEDLARQLEQDPLYGEEAASRRCSRGGGLLRRTAVRCRRTYC